MTLIKDINGSPRGASLENQMPEAPGRVSLYTWGSPSPWAPVKFGRGLSEEACELSPWLKLAGGYMFFIIFVLFLKLELGAL